MKIEHLPEPELEFGADKHVDIRFGLMNYAPFDAGEPRSPKEIRVGLVGTPETVEGIQSWLEKCRSGISAKKSNQPNLFPKFPGFGEGTHLGADLVFDLQLQKTILPGYFDDLCKNNPPESIVQQAVNRYLEELEMLNDKAGADVYVCAPPMKLVEALLASADGNKEKDKDENTKQEAEEEQTVTDGFDFHHLLKAKGMKLDKPIQIILPMTYDESKRLRQKGKNWKVRELQDEATRAWNIYTALYYKAGGTPWRIVRDSRQHTACYVGISFYKTLDNSKLMTSIAQVFNELGDGIILRGGKANFSKDDRQPHLPKDDAFNLLDRALKTYRSEHQTLPARVVLHKTSAYSEEEFAGFREALHKNQVSSADFISLRDSYTRLYRLGQYPPLRGTLLYLSEKPHLLYTRGAVDFYATYPGQYVPRPLEFHCEAAERTPRFIAQELLALTKMNWNNTQFDNDNPITIEAARKVGSILKYVGENDPLKNRYSYYM